MIFQQSTYQAGGTLQQREVWDSVALTYTVFNGAGAQVSQRPLTTAEQAEVTARAAAAVAETNANTLKQRAQTALSANQTFLAIAAPTNAQVSAQTKALTRQVDGLIRLSLQALSDVSDS